MVGGAGARGKRLQASRHDWLLKLRLNTSQTNCSETTQKVAAVDTVTYEPRLVRGVGGCASEVDVWPSDGPPGEAAV